MATEMHDQRRRYKATGMAGVFLLSALLVFTGCQSINPLPRFGVDAVAPEEARIRELMKWHSARVEVYNDFRTVFIARAVYLSDEIRQIAVDWEARSKLLSPEERAELEKRFLRSGEQILQVLIGFYTPEEELNDLNKDNSVWIPYLKNVEGTITRPSCFGLGGDEGNLFMRFLKWDLSWSRLYLLCFPFTPELYDSSDGWVTLVISGPQGQGEMRLRIAPPEDPS